MTSGRDGRSGLLPRAFGVDDGPGKSADSKLAMLRPITILITDAQILPCRLPSRANGNTIAATVTRPMIQPKNTRGRGVIKDNRWARAVAASASTDAVTA